MSQGIQSPLEDRAVWRSNNPRPAYQLPYWDYWKSVQTGGKAELEVQQTAKDNSFKVLDVDLQCLVNRYRHNTSRYDDKRLIVRRGQEFSIVIQVDKPFDKDEDLLRLQFAIGKEPRESRGTMFLIRPGSKIDTTVASAVIDRVQDSGFGSKIHVRVAFPCNSVVGRFDAAIRLQNRDDKQDVKKFTKYKLEEPITVLFNPWCKDDVVYMEDAEERDEYVMQELGQIFIGTAEGVTSRSWIYGQFDEVCLEAALLLLDSSTLAYSAYGNPVRVTRCLSAMLNSNDNDQGILTGNWSNDFSGGTPPTTWNGSVRILEEYLRTKKAVNYGQCWVFSGVGTTIGRALGIPTRVTTAFDSAHDRDVSMTIDFHVDELGEPIKCLNDSVWNYHVWNESWFKRPDLPAGNDGWQVFDATPQELSDNRMQCGPAPVAAVKEGNVHFGFDTPFVFGEVNGDRICWLVNAAEERQVVFLDSKYVGNKISTKAVGKRERMDITNLYKYPEGSDEERLIAKKVSQLSTRSPLLTEYYERTIVSDVTMTFEGRVTPEGHVEFEFCARNDAKDERTVVVNVTSTARYYTGVDGDTIGHKHEELKLKPRTATTMSWTMKAKDWINKIDADASIGVFVLAKVAETGQNYIYRTCYDIMKPPLDVTVPFGPHPFRKPLEVTVKFTNPLAVPLTEGSFMVEGAGFKSADQVDIKHDILPGQEVSQVVSLTPKVPGKREVVASFHSRQLVGLFGSVEVTIEE